MANDFHHLNLDEFSMFHRVPQARMCPPSSLAALCRARQIPTRVAIGLVHVPRPGNPEMAYHMWNEVWIKDHWYPLDATLGKGGIGAGHLKLTDSSLAGASAFSVLLPVTQVVRRLRVKIVSSQ